MREETKELIVRSTASADEFRLWPIKAGEWRARLSVADLQAEATVYERHSGRALRLDQFFGGLAENWRGWTGPREWDALGMSLAAKHDGLGNVEIRITVEGEYGRLWCAQASLIVGAGALAALAREASRIDVA